MDLPPRLFLCHKKNQENGPQLHSGDESRIANTPMESIVVVLDKGDVVQFTGQLVGTASAEIPGPGRSVTGKSYRLYRTDVGRFVLVLDHYEKIHTKNFCLYFNSAQDVRDYVEGDKNGKALGRQLFNGDGDGI